MALSQLQVGIEKVHGPSSEDVTNNPKAKLMFYVDCICRVIDLDDGSLGSLRNFQSYHLTDEQTEQLIVLCALLDPIALVNKVIFQNDEMCQDKSNAFYNLHAVNQTLAVVDSLVIGGVRRNTRKIMCFKMSWLEDNYVDPLREVLLKRRQQQAAAKQQAKTCVIL